MYGLIIEVTFAFVYHTIAFGNLKKEKLSVTTDVN